ncbi:hypothetical protein KIN20_015756, partial [Parelaphostrongylus tenuis]
RVRRRVNGALRHPQSRWFYLGSRLVKPCIPPRRVQDDAWCESTTNYRSQPRHETRERSPSTDWEHYGL